MVNKMKIILDDNVNNEIQEYLLTQEGILEVKIKEIDLFYEIEIKHNEKTTPLIIMKYIDLFQNNNQFTIMSFNKKMTNTKKLKYLVEDICCEYCYKGLVRDLFYRKEINSVKSNFDLKEPAYNVELEIEYDKNYKEEDIIKFIKDNI